jgi:ribosome-associated translation inhibitor RaiA
MQIQIYTDHNIEGHQTLITQFSDIVENALSRFNEHITQVDVHLSDENSNKKGGHDKMRCLIEAHLKGRQPVAVTDQADTLDNAVAGAADKLIHLIENTIGRQHDRESHRTDPTLPEPEFTKPS